MLIAKKVQEFEKTLIPEGSHAARIYSVVDLGTQTSEFQGESKVAHKVRITWEVPAERITDKEGKDMPRVIGKSYTLSIHERSSMCKDFSKVVKFGDEFDAFDLLGATMLLSITHVAKKDGSGSYATVSGVSALPKGMDCPAQENPTTKFSIDEWNDEVFADLPQFVQDDIAKSEEVRAKTSTTQSNDDPI